MKIAALITLTLLAAATAPASAAGDAAAGQGKAAVCAACHGADGNSVNPLWPKLAGQHASYTAQQVHAIKAGAGRTGEQVAMMVPMVVNLSDQDIADIAAYYETQSVEPEAVAPESIDAGQQLYRGGNAESGVPACMSCHGPAGRGIGPAAFPQLAGQHAQYTAAQLRAYRAGERTTDRDGMMQAIAERLSDVQIDALSQYVSGLH